MPRIKHMNRDGDVPYVYLQILDGDSFIYFRMCTKSFDADYTDELRFPFVVLAEVRNKTYQCAVFTVNIRTYRIRPNNRTVRLGFFKSSRKTCYKLST